jgi:hypothetical protein
MEGWGDSLDYRGHWFVGYLDGDEVKAYRLWIEVALAIAAVVFGFMWWQKFTEPAPVGVAVEAKPSKILNQIPTETVQVSSGVIAYKPAAKAKLRLPKPVQDNQAAVVTSATTVPADFRPHTVTTVLDTQTGKTTAYDTRMELPWVAINVRGEAGIGYFQTRDGAVARLSIRQGLASVKAVRLVGEVTFDQPLGNNPARSSASAGVMALYQW